MRYIFLLLFLFSVPTNVFATAETVDDTYKKIYCDEQSYIQIQPDTFKQEHTVLCEKQSQDEFAPIYEIKIYKNSQEILLMRKDVKLFITLDILDKKINDFSSVSGYFYDKYLDNWVSLNTNISDNHLEIDIFHTGDIKIATKQYQNNRYDIFSQMALLFLIIGLIPIIIYNNFICSKK